MMGTPLSTSVERVLENLLTATFRRSGPNTGSFNFMLSKKRRPVSVFISWRTAKTMITLPPSSQKKDFLKFPAGFTRFDHADEKSGKHLLVKLHGLRQTFPAFNIIMKF